MDLRAVAFAAFGLLLACGAHDGTPSLETRSLDQAYCRFLERCSESALLYAGGTVERCVASRNACEPFGSPIIADDASAAEILACKRALATAECGASGGLGDLQQTFCGAITQPVAAEGEPCGTALCQVPLACVELGGCLTCQRRRKVGEPCGAFAEGFPCESTALCIDGTCALRRSPGERCNLYEECASWICVDGKCAAPLPLGAPCDDASACGENECVDGVCERRIAVGVSCRASRDCLPDLECVAGRCAPPVCEPGQLGESCPCSAGLTCDWEVGKCDTPLDEDASCSSQTGRCGADRICDYDLDRCVPRAKENEACAASYHCQHPLFCAEDLTCRRPQPDGESCRSGSECASLVCARGTCGNAACE